MVSFDKCNRSCKALDVPSDKACVLNKSEIVNSNVYDMITKIHESKTSTRHTQCKCRCEFDGRKGDSNQKLNSPINPIRIVYPKKVMLGILVHVLLSVIKIVILINILKIVLE